MERVQCSCFRQKLPRIRERDGSVRKVYADELWEAKELERPPGVDQAGAKAVPRTHSIRGGTSLPNYDTETYRGVRTDRRTADNDYNCNVQGPAGYRCIYSSIEAKTLMMDGQHCENDGRLWRFTLGEDIR